MEITPSIFHTIVFDLHPKVREYLDNLNQTGQIDLDDSNSPHLMSVENPGPSTFRCVFLRNGVPVHALIHTRKKVDPIVSWDPKDGYMRKEIIVTPISRREREKRVFTDIVEAILPRRSNYELDIRAKRKFRRN